MHMLSHMLSRIVLSATVTTVSTSLGLANSICHQQCAGPNCQQICIHIEDVAAQRGHLRPRRDDRDDRRDQRLEQRPETRSEIDLRMPTSGLETGR